MRVAKVCICLLTLAALGSIHAAASAQDGLVGHWLAEKQHIEGQTWKDLTGKSDATILGTLSLATVDDWSALSMDGASTSASIREDHTQADLPSETITAEAWVRVDMPQAWGGIVGAFQDNASYERGWILGYSNDKFSFAVNAEGGPDLLTYLAAPTPFEEGKWYHVVGTYDGKEQKLYVNGALASSSKAQSGKIKYPPKAFYEIGAYRDKDEYNRLSGMLHEVRVYKRVADEVDIAKRFAAKEKLTQVKPTVRLRIPKIFSSNMVLQRERPLPVWGWAPAGQEVTVTLADKSAKAVAGQDGKWMVKLPPRKAGGPHELVVKAKNTVRFKDVYMGDVWVCSGQSNMQWGVKDSNNAADEIENADHPYIRLFTVPNRMTETPGNDVESRWTACNTHTIPSFSAVGYFFGRELHQNLDVPIGLINTSWGGSLCEAWTSREALESDPDFEAILERSQNNLWNGRGMYNAMIAPLIPYGIRGAIWYQGESNVPRAVQYRKLFPTMIRDWRTRWGQGDFPFYFVQLAPFNRYGGAGYQCAELWEAQTKTLALKNTGMVVTTDIGNVGDIHPRNKQDVGKRLALWALAKQYGRDIVYSGPLYKSLKVEGDKIRISFDHAAGGLVARDGKDLRQFTIAGEDQKFQPATAVVDGETVVVHSDLVKKPVAVRLGWRNDAEPNLMNKGGLPVSPFRTDDWPAVTAGLF